MRKISTATILASLALIASCAGNGDDGAAATSSGEDASAPISLQEIEGVGTVLVDSAGNTLYVADQERQGTIKCVASCLDLWVPVEPSEGDELSTDISDELATVTRPDSNNAQITFKGAPLYLFTLDGGPGDATGDGLSDTFEGTDFTWHAAVTSASSGGSAGQNTQDDESSTPPDDYPGY